MLYFFRISEKFVWVLDVEESRLTCLKPRHKHERRDFYNYEILPKKSLEILLFYLQFNNQEIYDTAILNTIFGKTPAKDTKKNHQLVKKSRTFLKKVLCQTSSLSPLENIKLHPINSQIFKKNLSKNGKKTIFSADVWIPNNELLKDYHLINNHYMKCLFFEKLYNIWTNNYELQRLEDNCSYNNFFNFLIENNPIESSYLYKVEDDLILPFILPKQHKIIFPMVISENEKNVKSENFLDSLLEQKKILNAKVFNGNIYRLVKQDQETGYWKLAKSCYFDILNSSDYLNSRLKAYYQRSLECGVVDDQLMKMLNLWKQRINQIITGDFSQYCAGLAFSIPTFRVLDNGSLQLLCAKGSQYKATSSGKTHVCPAGMLEFWGMSDIKELSFENFKSIATKEFFEETVLSDRLFKNLVENKTEDFKRYLDCFKDDGNPMKIDINFSTIDDAANIVIHHWNKIWDNICQGKPIPSLEAILKLRSLKDSNSAFMVIDAFNFRPEIIQPIYIKGELNTLVNWEYEDKPQIIQWKNMEELNFWVKSNYNHWCAPGIAAAYLGAKYYFENLYNE